MKYCIEIVVENGRGSVPFEKLNEALHFYNKMIKQDKEMNSKILYIKFQEKTKEGFIDLCIFEK